MDNMIGESKEADDYNNEQDEEPSSSKEKAEEAEEEDSTSPSSYANILPIGKLQSGWATMSLWAKVR
jgi:hypothetical protein